MKKIIALMLAVMMVLCFVGCGSSDNALVSEYESIVDKAIEAIEDGDQAAFLEASAEAAEIMTEYATTLAELQAEDPDAAAELKAEMDALSEKVETAMNNAPGDFN